jgi:hypothetical protein
MPDLIDKVPRIVKNLQMDDVTKKADSAEADGYFGEGDIDLGDSLNVDWLDNTDAK